MTLTGATVRRREISKELAKLGLCLPGSIVTQMRRCGTSGCHCHTDDAFKHGPYRLWSRKVAGKTVTRVLTESQFEIYKVWIDNARRLHELVAELEQLSVETMAEDEGWPHPSPPPPDRRRARGTPVD
jgi:uncharacterized protein DUF6788